MNLWCTGPALNAHTQSHTIKASKIQGGFGLALKKGRKDISPFPVQSSSMYLLPPFAI